MLCRWLAVQCGQWWPVGQNRFRLLGVTSGKHAQQLRNIQPVACWSRGPASACRQHRSSTEPFARAAGERTQANLEANKGKERKDLYTDNWAGAEYQGSPVNTLSVIVVISLLAPLLGIAFAYLSYGKVWG